MRILRIGESTAAKKDTHENRNEEELPDAIALVQDDSGKEDNHSMEREYTLMTAVSSPIFFPYLVGTYCLKDGKMWSCLTLDLYDLLHDFYVQPTPHEKALFLQCHVRLQARLHIDSHQ